MCPGILTLGPGRPLLCELEGSLVVASSWEPGEAETPRHSQGTRAPSEASALSVQEEKGKGQASRSKGALRRTAPHFPEGWGGVQVSPL